LGQLLSFIKSLKEEFTSCTASGRHGRHAADKAGPPTDKNLPEAVNNIVWGRELEAKVSRFLVCIFKVIVRSSSCTFML